MVTRLAVVGTALAACICCFEQDVESPLIISWLPTAWVFTRHLRAAAVVFLRFTDSVLRARAAHVPGDDHSDKRGSPYHATAGSESEEETRVSPEAPAQAPSSSAPESADSRSHRHGATDAPSGSTAAGLGCSEADQFGVASTVNLAGLGDVTYGVVALQQLRRQATALRQEWTNENTFVKMSVGRRCVDQPALPTVEQIRRWSTLSRKRFRARFPTRLREADHLETLANDVVKALENAGVSVPHDAEHSSSQPGTDDQTLTSGGDASGELYISVVFSHCCLAEASRHMHAAPGLDFLVTAARRGLIRVPVGLTACLMTVGRAYHLEQVGSADLTLHATARSTASAGLSGFKR
ncbi:KRUF family protein [Toxoplasma gondii ARI]|uniref:KRUF family protein n=1 Tax=Toxoplasma gondii ARI TaxID=1074872 RepID=A0A139Y1I8_TOXGO|nr:KRUF family protein [Toxoplasma gondii ARI]